MIASCRFGLLHGTVVLDWAALSVSDAAWLWLAMLVVLSTATPSFMMTEATSHIGPAQTSVVGMLGPVFTITLAINLLDEPFMLMLLVGVTLMMLGVTSLVRQR